MLTSRYVAGEGAAIIRPDSVALVAPSVSAEAANALWNQSAYELSASTITDILDRFGMGDVPFAAVVSTDTGLAVTLRGGASAWVQDERGHRVPLVSNGVQVAEHLPVASTITLMAPGREHGIDAGWLVESGLVGADQVTVSYDAGEHDVHESDLDIESLDATVLAASIRQVRAGQWFDVERGQVDVSQIHEDASAAMEPAAGGESARATGILEVVLATGLVVPLDRPILMGRAPIVSRAHGQLSPRLLTFDSPSRDISRTHVEVSQLGRYAVIRDLDSTNGVYVQMPGREPTKMSAREPMSVGPGTIVEIGDGASFLIRQPV